MTKLRWSDPPREADPARVLPGAKAPPVSTTGAKGKIPRGRLSSVFRAYQDAKRAFEKAKRKASAARRALASLRAVEERLARKAAEKGAPVNVTTEAVRAQALAAAVAKVEDTRVTELAAHEKLVALNKLWHAG